jgi:hypothetical protein
MLGVAWMGGAVQGVAIAADGSTEDFGPLCCSLLRVDEAKPGLVRTGDVRRGAAW